jgi:hypothetical protein
MLNSSDEPGGVNTLVVCGELRDIALQFQDFTPPSGQVTGVDLRSLPPGTELVVDTCNSRYRFVLLDPTRRDALVQGGRFFAEETRARLEGSTVGGSLLKIGWIDTDLFLEISVGRKRFVTSRVRSIRVEPMSARSRFESDGAPRLTAQAHG